MTTAFVHVSYVHMRVLSPIIEFEWDTGNLDKNYRKHGITPKEAEEVFVSTDFFVIPDVKHSQSEERFIGLGKTSEGKKLFVVFAHRQNKIRVISARGMHRKEVDRYEKAQKNSTL